MAGRRAGSRIQRPLGEPRTTMKEDSAGSTLHAVVHYPGLDTGGLREFRRKHDPFAGVIAEHLTLLFPIPLGLETIRAHVQVVATEVQPFFIRIAGLKRRWDHWLCAGLKEGFEDLMDLHDRLYSGPLEGFLRTDLPLEPQVGLGHFGTGVYDALDPKPVEFDSEAYDQARIEASRLGIDARRRVETLTIVRLDRRLDIMEDVAVVRLGS